jgi:hypothetical protein
MAGQRKSKSAKLREDALLIAVLTNPTITRAASAAGVSERTMRRALKRPAFARRVAAARRTAIELAVSSLAGLSGDAHDALRRNLTCGVPAVEVRAAVEVREGMIRGDEHLAATGELQELREDVAALLEQTKQREGQA